MGLVFLKEHLPVGECDICYSCNSSDFLLFFHKMWFSFNNNLAKAHLNTWQSNHIFLFIFFCMGSELF